MLLSLLPQAPRALPRCRASLSAESSFISISSSRGLHTSNQRPSPPVQAQSAHFPLGDNTEAASQPEPASSRSPSFRTVTTTTKPSALSVLPLSSVLRSLMTTTVSSSPFLLGPSMAIMTLLAHSTNPLLNPDKNLLLRFFLKKTFYAQFCAGENPTEVRHTVDSLKSIGFSGVILGYAKEVVLKDEEKRNLATLGQTVESESRQALTANEIQTWADGTLETVRLASTGDFVALKFSGAGLQALYHLSKQMAPSPQLAAAIDSICQLAVERGVRLLFDAEQQAVQAGIDDWTLAYMVKYNTADRAVVYGTYQAYLKATASILSRHLRMARDGGFALGVKLVRGAYLGSDPRHLIHDTKEDTDVAYDGIAEALLRREWRAPLDVGSAGEAFPSVDLVVASHNAESVKRAQAVMASGVAKTTDVAFGQLQGMADEISCQLVLDAQDVKEAAMAKDKVNSVAGNASGAAREIRPYKYLVWGSTGECMKYLLRRAHENRDAVQRTKSSRDAMWQELVRRTKAVIA